MRRERALFRFTALLPDVFCSALLTACIQLYLCVVNMGKAQLSNAALVVGHTTQLCVARTVSLSMEVS